MTPSSFCLAKVSSRSLSQPWSNLPLYFVGPFLRHVVRRVATPGGEVGEERLLGVLGPDRVQPLDRLVRHVVGQVVGVVRLVVVTGLGRADDLLVLGQARVPLAGTSAEEAVEVVEPPADGPAVERPGRALLAVRRQVPLAEGSRAVSVVPQNPREGNAVIRDERGVAREACRELADGAEADRVAVAAGEQRRPRRRAERGDVEAVVPHALVRHPRVVRCVDRPAEGGGIAEAGVVDEHHHDVRSSIGSFHMSDRFPVRLRSVKRALRDAAEGRHADRELASIGLAHGSTSGGLDGRGTSPHALRTNSSATAVSAMINSSTLRAERPSAL